VARCAGVAVAGSGVGTFVFAPLTDSLLTKYQWRGALVVCSAILLNVVVCGAVFRPLDTAARRLRLRRLSSLPANMATAPGGTSDAVLGHARSSAADMSALSSGRLVPIHRSRVAGTALDESAASIVSIDLLHDVEIHSSPSSITGSEFERKNSRIFSSFFLNFGKIRHLVATVLVLFPGVDLPNFLQFKQHYNHHHPFISGRSSLSVDEWLACWTQAQKGLASNRSRDAVG